MPPRFLLDTHILVRWLAEPGRLSRDQVRVLDNAVKLREALAVSAITLLELAMLFGDGALRRKLSLDELLGELENSPVFRIFPLTIEIAREASFLGNSLRDPADRVIVATARVHGLRLLTSDQRIIDANLVSTVE